MSKPKQFFLKSALQWMPAACLIGAAAISTSCGDNDRDDTRDTETENDTGADAGTDSEITKEKADLHCPGDLDEIEAGEYTCTVEGILTSDTIKNEEALTWISGMTYVLDGIVSIEEESELSILPGAVILGDPDSADINPSSLYIAKGSKIHAVGTKENPILFSSGAKTGERAPGDWGGVAIRGASLATCGRPNGENTGNGGACSLVFNLYNGEYGGGDLEASSGELAFVRIEFAGKGIAGQPQGGHESGLTLFSLGSNTDIHHVQIHRSGNVGLEIVGGTVPLHHILVFGAQGTALRWRNGWVGRSQYLIAHRETDDESAYGLEGRNDSPVEDAAPISHPILYNVTVAGSGAAGNALYLYSGTAGTLANLLVTKDSGFARCVDIADDSTWAQTLSKLLSISGAVFPDIDDCFADNETAGYRESDWWDEGEDNRILDIPLDTTGKNPSFALPADSPALKGAVSPPLGMSSFEEVDFVGAAGEDDWTQGWTEFPEN